MKLCEICGKRPATVFIRSQAGEQVSTHYLCAACAAKMGGATVLDMEGIADILQKLETECETESVEEPETDMVCPVCGTSYRTYREIGVLGCPSCYDAFSDALQPLLSRIHGASRQGEDGESIQSREANMDILKIRLLAAVSAEEYEEAARLRDCIHSLEREAGDD